MLLTLLFGFVGLAKVQAATFQTRIVGGTSIDITDAPATVALLRTQQVNLDGDLYRAQFCGGTVIGTRWILSAAHCLIDQSGNQIQASEVMVLMGSTSLAQPSNQPVRVTRIYVHEEYISTEQGKDIALLQIATDALVPAVALSGREPELNDIAFITGWGALNSPGVGTEQTYPNDLQGAYVRVIPGEECGERYRDYQGYTDQGVICAGLVEGKVDSCQGDSGGPLYRVNGVDQPIISVAGITSWGLGCAEASHPGVYTNVYTYLNWIRERTGIEAVKSDPGQTTYTEASVDPLPEHPDKPIEDQPVSDTTVTSNDARFLGSGSLSLLALLMTVIAIRQFRSA